MRYRYGVLALLVALSMITFMDRLAIAVAGPRIQAELGITPQEWGWVLGVFVLAYGLFEIPTGAMGDRSGRRRILVRIVLWWSAFTALTGLANWLCSARNHSVSVWSRRSWKLIPTWPV